ncbi:MAG: hypothetical protein DWQ45_16155 [Planctomycetota bacterium]|nr:MAG: hypothetical protein DWQ45_16155 [Planctomycetota bacterium]
MSVKLLNHVPARTAELVVPGQPRRLFSRDDRAFCASGLLMLVFSICGLALGMLGESDEQVAVFTTLGAAVGLTLSNLSRMLMK